jgi:hypothetical protein
MSKVAFGHLCSLPSPLILLPLAIFRTFHLNHPPWPLFSYDDILAFGRPGLRWPNQDLLPIKLDYVHVHWEMGLCRASFGDFLQILIVLHLWPIEPVDGNIAIISSMRIRIMPFTICMFF